MIREKLFMSFFLVTPLHDRVHLVSRTHSVALPDIPDVPDAGAADDFFLKA
jgi:hypothetical protein